MRHLAGEECPNRDCTKILLDDDPRFVIVQGDVFDKECAPGEAVVRIGVDVLLEAANAI